MINFSEFKYASYYQDLLYLAIIGFSIIDNNNQSD